MYRPLLYSAKYAYSSALRSAKVTVKTPTRLASALPQEPEQYEYSSTVNDVIPTLGLPPKFGHFINGGFVEPTEGQYFDNLTPINGEIFIKAARGTKADVDNAVKAAHAAFDSSWSKTSSTQRSAILLKIADTIEANAQLLGKVEAVDKGKAIRETNAGG